MRNSKTVTNDPDSMNHIGCALGTSEIRIMFTPVLHILHYFVPGNDTTSS